MKRRRFLKLSLLSSLTLGGVYGLSRHLISHSSAPQGRLGGTTSSSSQSLAVGAVSGRWPAAATWGLQTLSPRQGEILQAAALRILDGAEPSVADDGAVVQCQFIDGYLGTLDPPMQDDVRALLELLQHYPLLGYGARFTQLSATGQDAVLRSWQSSRWDLLRQAFHGLKSLCCLAHYQDARSFAAIGYDGPLVGRSAAEHDAGPTDEAGLDVAGDPHATPQREPADPPRGTRAL